ncbi:MAG: alpha/beta fold hydrolase [Tepidisphaeraceae bacterium]
MPTRTVNATTLHYEESDDASSGGTPLVLLHGFPLDRRVWEKQRAALSDRFRVISPDLRGFGKSASADAFTMQSLADDVHALLEAIGALPAVLGGLSMGGYVALEYVKKYPSDLRGLMLIDTKAEGDTPEGKDGRNKMVGLVRSKGSAAVAEAMMPKMLAPDTATIAPAVVRELGAIMEVCPPLTIEHALLAMRDRDDHTADLPSIAIPTLIIVGESDAITPPKVAQAMHAAIPHSQLAEIKDAGHMAIMEQPEQVNRAIRDFASRL